ncbi:DNA repair protein Rad18 [Aspergillus steynii IBT 23096]|uniref:DNA repair protein Rad18 n=1 Tax=Aspergillus steynii IBT 23096 TaxID=1392250 RepID=A0A2I2GFV5_9EURO|nr:DNA repair protein Rad18 [Aspergillus steynii IBT 23096]PLB51753.1 DNA repair protein Rad18 [Aspergillus steynii IBT 23096]
MPSLKRPRTSPRAPESDDESESEVSPVRSYLQKRTRRSNSLATDDNSGVSADDNEGLDPGLINEALGDEEDDLELRATQVIQEKYSFASDEPNVPAEHGILERVECYNFMCHDRFYVELGPLINFIVGKNGSGKSAVLTAITLCLGGKASATNRGQSLKSFIKEGKETATIVVRIKNQGDGAYMPDDYGRSIIVERHFSKNGTSGFKIKAENGRIVSTKKAELDSIIDFFTLQFDNPMNVLSQDMARQFLSTSSPAEKYKFFVKGVQLEQLDQDYRLIEESADQIEEKLRNREQDIEHLKNRRDAAKQKLDISDQHESLRNRLRNTRSQMAWAQVEEQEQIKSSLDDELVRAHDRITTAETELHGFDVAIRAAESETETASEYVQQAKHRVDDAQTEQERMKSGWDEKMSERHDLQAEQRKIREYLKAAETRISETQEKITEENQRLAELHGGSYARKQEQLEEARSEAVQLREQYDEHRREHGRLNRELEEASKAVTMASTPISKARADVEQAESRLSILNEEGGIKNSGFHAKMPGLLRAIHQERAFNRQPVGPIGNHVTLLRPEWSSILENSLGATLNSFIVTSKRDMNILSKIMQKVNCVCPIFIGSDGILDTSEHEPDSHFDTALRILQIDNELVRRQLIINHGIEQMLLIEKLDEASSVLFDGQRPRNVKRCYCIDQADRRRGIHLSYSRTGEPSQAPVSVYNGNPRMKSDLASQIRVQRDVVSDLKRNLNDLDQNLRLARAQVESCRQARTRHERKTNDLRVSMQQKEDLVEELSGALDREAVEDGHLDVLRATLEEAEEEERLNSGSLQDSISAMKTMMTELKAIQQQLAAKDADILALKEQVRVAQSEELLGTEKRRSIISDKNAALDRIQELKRESESISQEREEVAARILDYSEKANLVSPRVAISEGETPDSLDKKLDKLYKDVQRYNEQLGASRDEIASEAERTAADHERALRQVREFKLLANVLKATLEYRQKRWKIFRSHISSRAKAQFTYLLSERSFRGRLLTDHESKLLDLQVEPDITKDSTGRGAKTLSGGEKSFSQVCLLLALWEAMGSPIRCLDEFDVYMDHINRKMAIDMLMLAARRSIGRQFILITPGSRAEISFAPDVRVKELAEPERGQTRLSFRR